MKATTSFFQESIQLSAICNSFLNDARKSLPVQIKHSYKTTHNCLKDGINVNWIPWHEGIIPG
jgi:hypothetical protein